MRCDTLRAAVRASLLLAIVLGVGTARPHGYAAGRDVQGLGKLTGESVLTTSLQDAVTEVPFLDGFVPKAATPMTTLPRTPDGGFVLARPGNYLFECQSYCLDAGTYAPGEGRGGNGYLYAPWKGPQAHIIRGILRKSYLHPEISQEDVQMLLWAVIARSGIRGLAADMKMSAAKLLTPAEILEINSGALDVIAERLLDAILDRLPSVVRRIFEAQARLRELLSRAGSSYEDLESVAVLSGEPPAEEDDREIPLGRWSLHPDGYFLRYFPDGYSRLLIELNVPGDVRIEKDSQGRIIRMADSQGRLLEAEYEDSVAPLAVDGRPGLRACAFRALSLEWPDQENIGQKRKAAKLETGWTFVGLPDGEARSLAPEPPARFSDFDRRLTGAVNHGQDMRKLAAGLKSLAGETRILDPSPSEIEDILNLAHFTLALEGALGEDLEGKDGPDSAGWAGDALNLARRAWMSAVSRSLCAPARQVVFDPAEDPVPGQAASQRCGGSGRESENGRDCAAQYSRDRGEAMEDFGHHLDSIIEDSGVTCDAESLKSCVLDIFELDGSPNAYQDCVLDSCRGRVEAVLRDICAAMSLLHVRLNEIRDSYRECMGR